MAERAGSPSGGPARSPVLCRAYISLMETIGGKPVTDAMLRAWADEAEQGYDVGHLRARGRKVSGSDLDCGAAARLAVERCSTSA